MTHNFYDPQLFKKVVPANTMTAFGAVEHAGIGEGPTVVALHGALGGWDQGLIFVQTIGQPGYRYIAMSRPGYLGTPLSSGKSSEQQSDLFASLLDTLHVHTTTYPLEDLSVPVLVVHGTEDRLVRFEANAKMYEARVPDVELVSIDGGEHEAMFTHRNTVRPKVIEFMQHHFGA